MDWRFIRQFCSCLLSRYDQMKSSGKTKPNSNNNNNNNNNNNSNNIGTTLISLKMRLAFGIEKWSSLCLSLTFAVFSVIYTVTFYGTQAFSYSPEFELEKIDLVA